jgi:hypothetical protein
MPAQRQAERVARVPLPIPIKRRFGSRRPAAAGGDSAVPDRGAARGDSGGADVGSGYRWAQARPSARDSGCTPPRRESRGSRATPPRNRDTAPVQTPSTSRRVLYPTDRNQEPGFCKFIHFGYSPACTCATCNAGSTATSSSVGRRSPDAGGSGGNACEPLVDEADHRRTLADRSRAALG